MYLLVEADAVHGTDNRDEVPRAIAAVAAVVAHPVTRLGRLRRRRAVAAEGVVALEVAGIDVVDVNEVARGDVLAGEADDLPVLEDRLSLSDRCQRDLVSQTDPAGEGDHPAVVLERLSGRQGTRGDGYVVLGAQMNGKLRQRRGGHGKTTPLGGGTRSIRSR